MNSIQSRLLFRLVPIILGLALAACQRQTFSKAEDPTPLQFLEPAKPYEVIKKVEATQDSSIVLWPEEASRLDTQGAVEIEVIPVNLNQPSDLIEFGISLNTHSVDLNMDLVQLVSLETNTGLIIPALSWVGPVGGHHLQGVLSFPAEYNGILVMEGVTQMAITIQDVDVPERVFTWQR